MPELALQNVCVGFRSGHSVTRVIDDLSLTFRSGQFQVVAGPSGSGKTTLLSLLGALVRPDQGSICLADIPVHDLQGEALERYRREDVGYVFQAFRLMRSLSALDNVRLSLEIRGAREIHELAELALAHVGMARKALLKPDQMSGGEQQRVAIARAIAHRPRVLLADEPTANLDKATGAQIVKLLAELAHDDNRIVVAVSHDRRLIDFADRVVALEDGRVVGDDRCVPAGH